jgi:flagellar export protein FliJ
MADFRFRAQAALDLRRKQEDEASAALGQAEAACRLAEARRDQAEADRRTAQEQLATAERCGSDISTLLWHQNWIARLAAEVETAKVDVEARSADARVAEQAWRQARQKRLALERLRERAVRRHQHELQRQELKVIDELARLRFILADVESDDAA